MKLLTTAALAGALALTGAAAANAGASQYTALYSGYITGFGDGNTLFGSDAALGDGLTVSITYATNVPGTRTTSATSDEIFGGVTSGTDPVILSALFSDTVTGQTFSVTSDFYGDVYTSAGFLDAYGYSYSEANYAFQIGFAPDTAGPTNLQSGFESGGFADDGGAVTQGVYVTDGTNTVDFNLTHVSVTAAPEPGTWALMMAGVGLAGLALRRRTRAALSAA